MQTGRQAADNPICNGLRVENKWWRRRRRKKLKLKTKQQNKKQKQNENIQTNKNNAFLLNEREEWRSTYISAYSEMEWITLHCIASQCTSLVQQHQHHAMC